MDGASHALHSPDPGGVLPTRLQFISFISRFGIESRPFAGEDMEVLGPMCTDSRDRIPRVPEQTPHDDAAHCAATFELAAVGLAHVGPDGRWLRVNRKLCQIVGYAREELMALTFQDITHPDDLAGDVQNVRKMLAGEIDTYAMEKRYVRKDRSLVWVNLTVSLVRDALGRPDFFISVVEEVTARREAEAARAALAAIVESSDDAIVAKTLDGTVTSWNEGARRLFGYAAEEVIGGPVSILIPKDRRDEEAAILQRIRRGERVAAYETERLTKDGRRIDVSVAVSPVRDARGNVVAASKIARDISGLKKARRELQEAKEAAEAADRAKTHMLSLVSHELRTPLAPVLATVSLLEADPGLSPDARAQLATIRRNVEVQARLVDDLLDLTKLTRSKVELHHEVLNAHAAVRDALRAVQAAADRKGLELSVHLKAERHHVWADAGRVQQVLTNLLGNATKFTPAGGRVSVRTDNDAQGHLLVEVSDTGVGIEPDVLPKLFQPFEQGDRAVTRAFGGLGLGLTISKALAEMHHGTLTGASAGPGRGATFTLALGTVPVPPVPPVPPVSPVPPVAAPLGPGEASAPSAGSTPDPDAGATAGGAARALSILLVEDHPDTRSVTVRLLRARGHRVAAAGSVAEASALAGREHFDILICDLGLPDGTGLDVIRQVRARRPVRGIALTGYGTDEDVRRSHEAGFDTHLTKPVDFHALEKALMRLAS